jgi:hypothetical protein
MIIRQVQHLGIHWLEEGPGKLMLPQCLQDKLLQELDLIGDTAWPVGLWEHRWLHHSINRLYMRLFPWEWLPYLYLSCHLCVILGYGFDLLHLVLSPNLKIVKGYVSSGNSSMNNVKTKYMVNRKDNNNNEPKETEIMGKKF